MKKFIPIFSIVTAAVCLQNCVQREEDMMSPNEQVQKTEHRKNVFSMKQDSAKSKEDIENPEPTDPPVRDGDNWRH